MTREELAAIRERAEKSTPGPWVRRGQWIVGGDKGWDEVLAPDDVECGLYCYGGTSRIELSEEDADFIAHAREDIPALLTHIDELEAELSRVLSEMR